MCAVTGPNSSADLEAQADALLRSLPQDPHSPFYTEQQLADRDRGAHLVPCDRLALPAARQPLRDELRFLAAVSGLEPGVRLCVELWVDEWSLDEIGAAAGMDRRTAARVVRAGLRQCWEATVSFREFSHHTVYRRPSQRAAGRERACVRCGEGYLSGTGCGRYCGEACLEAALHAQHGP